MKYVAYISDPMSYDKSILNTEANWFLKDVKPMPHASKPGGIHIPGGEGKFRVKYMYDTTVAWQNMDKHFYDKKLEHYKKKGLYEKDPMINYTLEGLTVVVTV